MDYVIEPKDGSQPLLERYRRMRDIMRQIHTGLIDQIPRREFREIRKRVGLDQVDEIDADQEAAMFVMFDAALYSPRRQDRSIVQRHAKLHADKMPPNDQRRRLLEAMADSWYSLFEVVQVRPGLGADMRDIIGRRTVLMVDENFSRTLRSTWVLATRMIDHGDFCTTAGAAIIASKRLQQATRQIVEAVRSEDLPRNRLTPKGQSALMGVAMLEYFRGADRVLYV